MQKMSKAERKADAEAIAEATGSHVVQVLGGTALLYSIKALEGVTAQIEPTALTTRARHQVSELFVAVLRQFVGRRTAEDDQVEVLVLKSVQ